MSKPAPLILDLDGTLIKNDTTFEMILLLVKRNPLLAIVKLLIWLTKGKAALKEALYRSVGKELNVSVFPFNTRVIKSEVVSRAETVYIFSGAYESILKRLRPLLEEQGLKLNGVFGTTNGINLIGTQKLRLIQEKVGKDFDYIGDSYADLPIWSASNKAYTVNASSSVKKGLSKKKIEFTPLTHSISNASKILTFLRSMRIHHWVKNSLLFVVMGLNIVKLKPTDSLLVLSCFLMFSLIVSGTYIINDLLDLQDDRLHYKKKNRPVAKGDLSIPSWILFSSLLIFPNLIIGFYMLGFWFFIYSLSYIIITLSYSLKLKQIELVDVFCLSGLFCLRVIMGAAIIEKPVSVWFMIFILLFFLSLAIGKRVVEMLKKFKSEETSISGRGYTLTDLAFMNSLGLFSGLSAATFMMIYLLLQKVLVVNRSETAVVLFIGMFWWVSRLYLLINRGAVDDDPVIFCLKDKFSIFIFLALIIVFTLDQFIILKVGL